MLFSIFTTMDWILFTLQKRVLRWRLNIYVILTFEWVSKLFYHITNKNHSRIAFLFCYQQDLKKHSFHTCRRIFFKQKISYFSGYWRNKNSVKPYQWTCNLVYHCYCNNNKCTACEILFLCWLGSVVKYLTADLRIANSIQPSTN